jgi:hypothetical protein
VSFALPPIASVRDAADINAAVTVAVSNGAINIGEAVEIGKLIDSYVRAYKAAELDDRVAHVEQMTDAELLRIVAGGHNEPAQQAAKLLNPR